MQHGEDFYYMLKIICILVAILLPIAMGFVLVTNFAFFQQYNSGLSFGSLAVTVLVFIILAVYILKKVSDKYCAVSFKLQAIVLCVVMLIVPLRTYEVTRQYVDIEKKVSVEYVDFKDAEGITRSKKVLSLKFSNDTDMDINSIPGQIKFYDGVDCVATYDITVSNIPAGTATTFDFDFFDSEILVMENSKLNIMYTFECINFADDFENTFEPVKVRLK